MQRIRKIVKRQS